MPRYDTVAWPYLKAKYVGPRRTGAVRLVVIHTAEANETISGAEDLARYGQHPDYVSSWHIAVDSDSIVQSVKDSYVAYAAPGANHDGIQLEVVCYKGQSARDWLDRYSLAALAIAGDAAAQYCLKYDLPPVHLTDAGLLAGDRGIVGHDQVTRVYRRSDHTDPGPNFPWARFVGNVRFSIEEREAL